MKHIGKLAVLGAVLAASAPFASADSITLGSFGLTTGYNPGAITVSNTAVNYVGDETYATVALIPATPPAGFSAVNTEAYDLNPDVPVWNAALPSSSWVGFDPNVGPLGSESPAFGYYEFTTSFTLTGTYSGTLSVMADDTTEVLITNSGGTSTLVPLGALGGDGHCADNEPNCIGTPVDSVNITGLSGVNTLTFIVEQAGTGNGDPTGFDFDATLTSTPEPNSLILLGTGLLGAAGVLVRKRQTV